MQYQDYQATIMIELLSHGATSVSRRRIVAYHNIIVFYNVYIVKNTIVKCQLVSADQQILLLHTSFWAWM